MTSSSSLLRGRIRRPAAPDRCSGRTPSSRRRSPASAAAGRAARARPGTRPISSSHSRAAPASSVLAGLQRAGRQLPDAAIDGVAVLADQDQLVRAPASAAAPPSPGCRTMSIVAVWPEGSVTRSTESEKIAAAIDLAALMPSSASSGSAHRRVAPLLVTAWPRKLGSGVMSSSTRRRRVVGASGASKVSALAGARVGEGEALGVQERPRQPLHGADVVRHAARGRRRRPSRRRSACPMALRCTRIWCVRPVAMATRISVTPGRWRAQVTRVTACAGAAGPGRDLLAVHGIAADRQVDALAVVHDAPDQRDVLLLDLAVVELAGQLLVAPGRAWRRPSRPRCPCRGGGRCPAAARRRCRSGRCT